MLQHPDIQVSPLECVPCASGFTTRPSCSNIVRTTHEADTLDRPRQRLKDLWKSPHFLLLASPSPQRYNPLGYHTCTSSSRTIEQTTNVSSGRKSHPLFSDEFEAPCSEGGTPALYAPTRPSGLLCSICSTTVPATPTSRQTECDSRHLLHSEHSG